MDKPLVSIISPMYNGEKYIDDMIQSVINQTYKNWELIIVDDCSIDKSYKIVERYIKIDNRIRIIKQNKNKGPAKARNIAIENAKGKYIAFLDCDDVWINTKLEKQIEHMEKYNIGISCTSYKIASEDLKKVYKSFIVPRIINYKDLLKQNYFSCDTVVINKNIVSDVKMRTYPKHEDYLTWLNLMKDYKQAHGIQEPLAIYRVRENSRSSGKIDSTIRLYEIFYKEEKLGLTKSLYYTLGYIMKGIIKYKGIK